MGIDMKYIIASLLLLPLFGCYSTETVEYYVHSVARTYGIQYGGEKYFALRQTQWDEEERGDKRRRKTIRKRERQRG